MNAPITVYQGESIDSLTLPEIINKLSSDSEPLSVQFGTSPYLAFEVEKSYEEVLPDAKKIQGLTFACPSANKQGTILVYFISEEVALEVAFKSVFQIRAALTISGISSENRTLTMMREAMLPLPQKSEFYFNPEAIPHLQSADWKREFSSMVSNKETRNKQALLEFVLKSKYRFQKNEILERIEFSEVGQSNFKPLTEGLELTILSDIQNLDPYLSNLTRNRLSETVNATKNHSSYDPIKSTLDNLPTWEGKLSENYKDILGSLPTYTDGTQSQIETVLELFTFDGEDRLEKETRARISLKRFACGFYRSLAEENAFNSLALFLIGAQGVGKTSFFRGMFSVFQRELIYENFSYESREAKEIQRVLGEKIVLFLDEGEAFLQDKRKLEQLKSLITTPEVTYRLPYARQYTTKRRLASFVGSSNQKTPYSDSSGGRRFAFLEVEDIDLEQLKTIDWSLFWSEVKFLYESDRLLPFLSKEEEFLFNAHSETMRAPSMLEEWIVEKYSPIPFYTIEDEYGKTRYFQARRETKITTKGLTKAYFEETSQVLPGTSTTIGTLLGRKFEKKKINGIFHFMTYEKNESGIEFKSKEDYEKGKSAWENKSKVKETALLTILDPHEIEALK